MNNVNRKKLFIINIFELLTSSQISTPFKISQTSCGKLYISYTTYMGQTISALYRTATKQPSFLALMFSGLGLDYSYMGQNENKARKRIEYIGDQLGEELLNLLLQTKKEEDEYRKRMSHNLSMLSRSYKGCPNELYLIKKISRYIVDTSKYLEIFSVS